MNEAGSGTTTYSYDTAGRLASLVNPFSETTSFVYDTLGRVGQKTLANGTAEHYAYDTRSRLTQVQLKQGATVLRTTGYAWDNANQITSQTVNGVTTNYGYDLAGQITSEVRSGYNVAYTYDANGNRLSKTVNGVAESYTYDLGDKMLTAGAKSYTYDAAGRTVGINAPGGTTTLTYDYESRVTAITGPGINETHTYNGLDTRVGTVQGGVSRTFVRDGSYVTDPVLRDGQATYTTGVSERRGGVSTWSHSGLKNVDAQTSGAGAIQATRVYDAFGAELSATGTWKGPFGYAGGFGYQEDSSGLKLLGHRYYDPTTGRFLSRDPIKDGRNWYVYCGNAPTTRHDSSGLTSSVTTPGGAALAAEIAKDTAGAVVVSPKPVPVVPEFIKWALALLGLSVAVDAVDDVVVDTAPRERKPEMLCRVIGPEEQAGTIANGLRPIPSPTADEKLFHRSPQDSAKYFTMALVAAERGGSYKESRETHEIWCWPKTPGVGYAHDGKMDGLDVWIVPNGQLPLIPPGGPVNSW